MEDIWAVAVGIFAGTAVRFVLLRSDYRAYPSAPNGVLIHGTVGFVSATLGAVAVPSLFKREFVAVTFLAVAVLQLREVRRAERESLKDLERSELVPRGRAYIDGLAKGFESRNYVALLVAFITTAVAYLIPMSVLIRIGGGLTAGLFFFKLLRRMTDHKTVGDFTTVAHADITYRDGDVFVGDLFCADLSAEEWRRCIAEQGTGFFILKPKHHAARITLTNQGLHQAIVHEISRIVGVHPLYRSRVDFQTGHVALYIIPMKQDTEAIIEAIKNVPLFESVLRPEP